MASLNPHEAPPQDLKDLFKKYQKLKPDQYVHDEDLIRFGPLENVDSEAYDVSSPISTSQLQEAFGDFLHGEIGDIAFAECPIYSSRAVPGLVILPSLLPPPVQKELLSRLMHRDMSDPEHKTNLDFHHVIVRPQKDASVKSASSTREEHASFFSLPPFATESFLPKDPDVHKPYTTKQVLEKKMRWITLGGQYDWTRKEYPEEEPPDFPHDIARLVEILFPEMKAQAAIVNLYSPGDTLSLHRDVSEEVDRGLVSISLGCDCIFIIGLGPSSLAGGEHPSTNSRYLVLRLRSGDAVYMSKDARYAWHGVPKIIAGTCPAYLANWPAEMENEYESWRGWMSSKRINLNIRQMRE
ncbi:hypothetical protein BP5796_03828 [Coleophoma crateriformis]|uniref:mRNA N(6)-methyladenine demethylase n=1 Tax=Coleophoma crateriformis TaxID=565419 RepID=A0A3D8SGT4_9HELO|nr:hypothetical protein BP5796_03828 [Coleophoma crateriformis]